MVWLLHPKIKETCIHTVWFRKCPGRIKVGWAPSAAFLHRATLHRPTRLPDYNQTILICTSIKSIKKIKKFLYNNNFQYSSSSQYNNPALHLYRNIIRNLSVLQYVHQTGKEYNYQYLPVANPSQEKNIYIF